jgi:protein-disulfide isomerase
VVKKKAAVAPKKSRGSFYALLAIILLVGVAGIWYKIADSKQPIIQLDPNAPLPTAMGYLRGDSTAPVTIIEYGDFECPGCMQFATMLEPDLRANIIDKGLASFRFYDYPLTEAHPNSMSASLAAACADEQGKFWEMHDAIFEGFYDWIAQKTSNPKKVFQTYLPKIGINEQQWNQCFDSQKYVGRIMANRNSGTERGVSGTPTIIINNAIYPSNGLNYDRIKRIVDSLTAISKTDTSAKR